MDAGTEGNVDNASRCRDPALIWPQSHPQGARTTLVAIGMLIVASIASYAVFAVKGEPFGILNDLGNALAGAASGVLAWQVRRRAAAPAGPSGVATLAGTSGAAVAVVGSVLTTTKITGYLLAAFVSTVGFALVGVWLIEYNRSLRLRPGVSRRLTTFGIATGSVMAFGFTHLPAAVLRYDDFKTAPVWTSVGFAAWAGTYFLFPAWCFWVARVGNGVPIGTTLEPPC